ncbi:MAG TPA: hypothetical protein VN181_03560 [Thermoanaerobaculia bacterium]|nr:hypothetical protein [Thermoanaerobaculia bacterium]
MRLVAWFSALAHVAASAVLILYLRPGLPPNDASERIAYIAANLTAWQRSWYVWHVAGLSFVALCIVLARRLRAPLGAIVAVIAIFFDIHSEQLYMHRLPMLDGEAFRILDRWLDIENAGIANLLYTIAMAILIWRGRDVMPRAANLSGGIAVAAGVLMTIGALLHSGTVEIASGAILFSFFVVWCIVIARWLPRSA